jgi:NSS family neurotransmitter:Na+ symporter
MTYNSYRARRSNQTAPGLVVGFANSSFEILAGIGVFSVLGFMATQNGQTFTQFAANAKISGVSLSFITFPKVVSQMPQPWLFGALFFGSLFMAAFTSMLSILEVVSSALQDKFGWTRRRAALTLGIPMAVVSLALFGSPGAEYAVDTVDKFTNEIGIVASAIMMIVAVLWIRRKGPELSYHLSSLSTFKVGRTWRFLVTFLAPVVLAVLLVSTVWDLVAHGYGGYPTWFVIVCGWGVLILILVGTVLFKSMGWKHSGIDDFTPWPLYPPLSAGVSKSAGRGGSAAKNAKGERA